MKGITKRNKRLVVNYISLKAVRFISPFYNSNYDFVQVLIKNVLEHKSVGSKNHAL